MKKILWTTSAVFIICVSLCTPTQAALQSRLAGQAYYDTVLDVTLLGDANLAAGSAFDDGSNHTDGRMSWASALAWAASLEIGGITGWRLASMDRDGNGLVVDCGSVSASACTDNEYGYQFFVNGIDSSNPGPFANVGTENYWSSTQDGSNAWLFDFTFNDGSQLSTSQNYNALAWAVHAGDVALVPLPPAVLLFVPALLGMLRAVRAPS